MKHVLVLITSVEDERYTYLQIFNPCESFGTLTSFYTLMVRAFQGLKIGKHCKA